MSNAEIIKNKLKRLPSLMNGFVQDAFEEFDSVAEDFNIEQLDKGERSDGSSLPNYSPVSVAVYGKPEGAMTLKDKGAFHKSITLTAGKTDAIIDAKDPKTDMLIDNYGEAILGISVQNQDDLNRGFISPSIQDSINKFIKT